MHLNTISHSMDQAKAHRKEETANNSIPGRKSFFRPIMSANRPKGRRKAAESSKKTFSTQLTVEVDAS